MFVKLEDYWGLFIYVSQFEGFEGLILILVQVNVDADDDSCVN